MERLHKELLSRVIVGLLWFANYIYLWEMDGGSLTERAAMW